MPAAQAPLGRILTFYSYKGGTGRSMALANMAWVLASAGRRVLAVDWDLEAPGLHRYFRPFLIDEEVTASEGLMDLVDSYANEAIRPLEDRGTADPQWYLPYADLSNYVVSVNFPHFRAGGKIDFLPAGRQGNHYALAVSSFNWQNFYDRLGGGGFFEAVKQQARAEYDYVLIDSRTGVSDTAGICSVQMPDTLVVCFTYNNQSIKGASAVARSAMAMHDKLVDEKLALHRAGKAPGLSSALEDATRPYRVFPVPMRVDSGESDRLAIRQAFARASFADMVDHIGADAIGEYWKSVEVPHTAFYSYEEVLAPFKDDPHDPKTLLAALLRLTRYVTDLDVTDFQLLIEPSQRQMFLDAFAETPLTTQAKAALSESQRETEEQTRARTAEAALSTLSDAEQILARRVLLRLIRVGREEEGGGYFPIRASLGDFSEPEARVIEHLASHRVLTVATEGRASASPSDGPERSVSLADARLLTSWRTLIDWIERDREFLTWRQQLRQYLADWERSGRDRGALLSGRLLGEADLVALRRSDDLTPAQREYIAQSRNAAAPVTAPVPAPSEAALPTASPAWPGVGAPQDPSPAAAGAQRPQSRAGASRWTWVAIGLLALVVGGVGLSTLWALRRPSPAPGTPATSVRVPRLIGLPSAEAKTAAESVGLTVVMRDPASAEAPFMEGVVVEQSPGEQAMLARGGMVRLTVSTVTTAAPTLVGQDLTAALKALDNQRLTLGKTESRYVPDAPLGNVITQQPLPGTKVAAGTQVDVVVAREAQLSDFRIGIYFADSSDESRKLAERLRGFARRTGSATVLSPRPDQFFAGRLKPQSHEIRYSSPAERRAAEELQRLLQQSGDYPPFTPTLVRQKSEGFISVFIPSAALAERSSVSLTIEGVPGEDVQIWHSAGKGAADAPIVYTGKLGSDGRVVVSVPRASLVLGRPGRNGGVPLDLRDQRNAARTVRLPRPSKAY